MLKSTWRVAQVPANGKPPPLNVPTTALAELYTVATMSKVPPPVAPLTSERSRYGLDGVTTATDCWKFICCPALSVPTAIRWNCPVVPPVVWIVGVVPAGALGMDQP